MLACPRRDVSFHLPPRTQNDFKELISFLVQYAGVMFVSRKRFIFQSVCGQNLANPCGLPPPPTPTHHIMPPHIIPLKMAAVISRATAANTLCNARRSHSIRV